MLDKANKKRLIALGLIEPNLDIRDDFEDDSFRIKMILGTRGIKAAYKELETFSKKGKVMSIVTDIICSILFLCTLDNDDVDLMRKATSTMRKYALGFINDKELDRVIEPMKMLISKYFNNSAAYFLIDSVIVNKKKPLRVADNSVKIMDIMSNNSVKDNNIEAQWNKNREILLKYL